MARDRGGAEIKKRGDQILIIAHALFGALRLTDWDAFSHRISVEDTDARLGAALRLCLLRSRTRTEQWMRSQRLIGDYNIRLAEAFGLGSTRTLFQGMKSVDVDWAQSRVILGPTRNRRGGHFSGFEGGTDRGHEEVVVAFGASDAELGIAVREALRRCL